MNLFETVKQNITLKHAAERYDLLTKPNGLLLFPFHDGHEPSLKLMSDFRLTQDAASASSPNIQPLCRDFLKQGRHALRVLEAYKVLLADWKIRYALPQT